jgi:hypothetical protein
MDRLDSHEMARLRGGRGLPSHDSPARLEKSFSTLREKDLGRNEKNQYLDFHQSRKFASTKPEQLFPTTTK